MAFTEENEKLFNDVKAFLGITWSDEDTDKKVEKCISSSISRLNSIAGFNLDFINVEKNRTTIEKQADAMALDLLFHRCFYYMEKALDDFEKNFSRELLAFSNLCVVIHRGKKGA